MVNNEALLELYQRELATRRLRYFIPYVFPQYRVTPYSNLMCDAVDLVAERKINRLMIFVQPRRGKSEIVSRKFPPYYLGRWPDREIILTSYAAKLATTFSREARDLINNERYQNLFGLRSAALESEVISLSETAQSTLNWRIDGRRGGVIAAGVGGGISGQGAHVLIIDDPVADDAEAQSEKDRETKYNWYMGAARTRLADPKIDGIILCMTRWHSDDLAGRLLRLQEEVGEYWYVLRLPALAETPVQNREWCEQNFVDPMRLITPALIEVLNARTS